MTQYFFALVNPEVESLFKLEMKLYYPQMKLAYSRSGFFTFKGGDEKKFQPLMCRLSGRCLGKIDLKDLKAPFWAWKRTEELNLSPELTQISDNTWFKIGDTARLLMMVGENEFWLGEYELEEDHLQTPGEVSFLKDVDSPSRAYYKIAEAAEALNLDFGEGVRVLELGSAPGGASQFLLEQGCEVIGVDPALMDPKILKFPRFKHFKVPFESLTERSFKDRIDWIVSDINLPPTVVIKEVLRLESFLKPKGLVLTLKLNQDKHLEHLGKIVSQVEKAGFRIFVKHLPTHRKEVALIAWRS